MEEKNCIKKFQDFSFNCFHYLTLPFHFDLTELKSKELEQKTVFEMRYLRPFDRFPIQQKQGCFMENEHFYVTIKRPSFFLTSKRFSIGTYAS